MKNLNVAGRVEWGQMGHQKVKQVIHFFEESEENIVKFDNQEWFRVLLLSLRWKVEFRQNVHEGWIKRVTHFTPSPLPFLSAGIQNSLITSNKILIYFEQNSQYEQWSTTKGKLKYKIEWNKIKHNM